MVLGCVFLVDNALLIEDFSRRKGNPTNNPKPITQNQIYQASASIRLQS